MAGAPRAAPSAFVIGVAGMFAVMYSTQAILPELAEAFGVRPSETGLTVSVVVLAASVGAWVWGPVSDRLGRKRALVTASALVTAPTVAVACAPTFDVLLALRALQGLCLPGLLTVGGAYVVEVFGPDRGGRAMGYYIVSLVAGGLVARIGVAQLTALVGWRAALGALAALPLGAAVLMAWRLPDAPQPATAGGGLRALGGHLRNAALLRATAVGCCMFFCFVGFFSYLPFRLAEPPFGWGPEVSSLVFVLWGLGLLAPRIGGLVDRRGWPPVARVALGLSAAGALLSLSTSPALLLPALVLVTLANFAASTSARLGSALAVDADRGLASALYFSLYYAAGALAGYVPGLAWERWGWPGVAGVLLVAQALALAALLSGAPLRRWRRSAAPPRWRARPRPSRR